MNKIRYLFWKLKNVSRTYTYKVENIVVDELNRNNRIYTRQLLEEAIINNSYVKELLDHKALYIELGQHENLYNIDLKEICAVVKKIYIRDKYLYVKVAFFKRCTNSRAALSIRKKLRLFMIGNGDIDTDNKVTNYIFTKFYFN